MLIQELTESPRVLLEDRIVHSVKSGPWTVQITQHSVDRANDPRGNKMSVQEFLAAVAKFGSMTTQIEQHAPGERCWLYDPATDYSFLIQRRSALQGTALLLQTVFPHFPVSRASTPTYKMS